MSTLDILNRVKSATVNGQVIAVNTYGIPVLWVVNPHAKVVVVKGKRNGVEETMFRFRNSWVKSQGK